MGKRSFVVAAIPAFNEEKTIARVVLLAQKHVDKVVVCDDGSRTCGGLAESSHGWAEVFTLFASGFPPPPG